MTVWFFTRQRRQSYRKSNVFFNARSTECFTQTRHGVKCDLYTVPVPKNRQLFSVVKFKAVAIMDNGTYWQRCNSAEKKIVAGREGKEKQNTTTTEFYPKSLVYAVNKTFFKKKTQANVWCDY